MTRSPGQGLSELRDQVVSAAESLQRKTPEFSLDVGWASSYDALFAGDLKKAGEQSVLDAALKKGRCIVAGRGGAGKTQMLHRLMLTAAHAGIIAVLIDLKNWTKDDYGAWTEWTESAVVDGVAFLLERFSQPAVDALGLDYLPPSTIKLLIVDGLNEIVAPIGQKILLALDEFVGHQIGLSVLVVDRLTRRALPSPHRWAIATPLLLSDEVIASHCGDEALRSTQNDSLRSPYFLDAAIRKDVVAESPSETHRRFLHDHGGLEDVELQRVAEAAYGLYLEARTRTFSKASLVARVGADLADRLLQNVVIVQSGESDSVQFAHHLLHDYLAARHVASLGSDQWTSDLLQVISLDGASFDTISMVLSQLREEAADIFLRSLYDWNLYAAAYALSDADEKAGPSHEMRLIIYAMLAEKRFDIVEPTRERASDALAITHSSAAIEIKACNSLSDLLDAVGRAKSEKDWFSEWATLFLRAPSSDLPDQDLERIRDGDSIYGWTVANVARRSTLTSAQVGRLREWLSDSQPVVRWRIVHVLGSHPSTENSQTLLASLKGDEDSNVRYGAVRSLVEQAARADNDDLRLAVRDLLVYVIPELATKPKLKQELRNAMLIVLAQAPASWWGVIAPIARRGFESEQDLDGQEAWRSFVDVASARYASV
jgi:hypothetical protein